jgi:hypothetical protein
MQAFINHILEPHFVLAYVALLICLGSGWPAYTSRANYFWIFWFIGAVLALIVCVKLAFGV